MWEHLGPVAAILSLIFAVLASVVGMLLRNSMLEMGQKIADNTLELTKAITAARVELDDRIERQAREFGETAAALRQKITEVEIWARDNFVRRDSFYKVTGDLSVDIKDLGKDIKDRIDSFGNDTNARLDRMENKIDEKA